MTEASSPLQIAIDGPAASGKSTAARGLAAALNGLYVNTGDMYRTVAWDALRSRIDFTNHPEQLADHLATCTLAYQFIAADKPLMLVFNGIPVQQDDIRTPDVAMAASKVATIPAVRAWMTQKQRDCATLPVPIVMEGRDIGTVILPHASFKFFVTASPEERAQRRLAQNGEAPSNATLAEVVASIVERDRIDSTRAVAPLKPADDAIQLVTDGMTREDVVQFMLNIINQKA